MTLIGKHVLDLEDIKHLLVDGDGTYIIIRKSGPPMTGLRFSDEEYEHLIAELGVEVDFPHTDITYLDGEDRYVAGDIIPHGS